MSDTNQNSCSGGCGNCGCEPIEATLEETSEEIVLSMEEATTPVAASFDQFIESVAPEGEDTADEEQMTALRAVYFAGALDVIRLIKNGATIMGDDGEPLQQGYSLFELESEIRESLGIDEEEGEAEPEEEISSATKQVIGNIVGKMPE